MLLNGSFAAGPSGGKRQGNKLSQNCKNLLRLHKVYLVLLLLHDMLGGEKKDLWEIHPDWSMQPLKYAMKTQYVIRNSINKSLSHFLEMVLALGWVVDEKIPRKTKTSLSKSVSLLVNEEPGFAMKDLTLSGYDQVFP